MFIAATQDAKIRAFDAATGALLWESALPAPGYATPSTYAFGGRHYVVIAAGGGKLGTPSAARSVYRGGRRGALRSAEDPPMQSSADLRVLRGEDLVVVVRSCG